MTAWKKVSLGVVCLQLAWVGCGGDGDKVASLEADAPDSSMEAPDEEGDGAAGAKAGGKKGSAGKGSNSDPAMPVIDPKGPDKDATEFVSADPAAASGAPGVPGRGAATPGVSAPSGAAGSASASPPAAMQPESAADGGFATAGGAVRSVERGDIYRVLGDQRILNLNSYRGLQVIDISDVEAPRIEGRFAVAGTPVEMYVIDQRAIVLLNDWQGYYGSRDDVQVEGIQGGLVLNIDISDRAAPKLLSQAIVSGYISTSRLTTGTGQSALYVAASVNQNEPPYGSTTLVKSFDVSGNEVKPKSEIDLGGYVQDVQATTDLLLVSSVDYNNMTGEQRSVVSLVDISRPDGTMQRGGSVTARGFVQNKFNMDAHDGVLRVVSGSSWTGTQQNHLETFSLNDLANPVPLDECSFGQNEQLYATIFIEDRAFFVTYFRTDPLHAFTIDAQGRCEEHNAFVVSGWNDFLRPTLDGSRLIGVGINDENNRRTVSVSLYDAVNVDNPNPLFARADLAIDNSYSEAQWDDRAFSVIEDAVSVRSNDDLVETGLVLVPFQGYNATTGENVAQVQILTFSDRTLTRRGVMDHGTPVRRSFLADESTAANLSEQELRLFDLENPSLPVSQGRVEVAPNYRQLLVYGDHVARVHDSSYYYGYYPGMTPPSAQVEIVARDSDLDTAVPVAEIEVPATATLTKVGDLLVSTLMTAVPPDGTKTDQYAYMTTIQVYDLSDPANPQRRGSLETDRLQPNYGYPYPYPGRMGGIATAPPGIIDCFDCWGPSVPSLHVVGEAIVYQSGTQQQNSLGFVESCYEYPSGGCEIDPRTQNCTTFLSGQITCTTYRGKPEMCSGEFVECPADGGECKPVDPDTIPTQKQCSTYEDFRYWQSYNFDALDLRDANDPQLADRLEMKGNEEGTSVIVSDSALYYNYQTPHTKQDDPRSYVKRFFREIDFADPRSAKVGSAINVPGDVIAVADPIVFTRDFVYDEDDVRTMVARLEVDGDVARLRASRVFSERTVDNVKLDGAGHILVSNGPAYGYAVPAVGPSMLPGELKPEDQPQHKLTILSEETLDVSGEVDIDSWATFSDAKAGRALFAVNGGLLVVNVEDPAKPHAQAFFRTIAWPSEVYFDGQEAMFAGGPYGIYRFDTDVFNLLMK